MVACVRVSRWRLLAIAVTLAASVALIWVLRDRAADPMRAIGPEAAYITCERVAERGARPPRDPWAEILPAPYAELEAAEGARVPAALLSNDMHPYDLGELGFAEGSMVCAAWLAPSNAQVTQIGSNLAQVGEAMRTLEDLAQGCGCASARARGLSGWISRCRGAATSRLCKPDGRLEAKLYEAAGVLESAFAAAAPARDHWRLAGPIGRPGRLAALHVDIAAHLGVGGDAFAPDGRRPRTGSDPLVESVLEVDDVQAVLRVDGSRGLVVIREIGRLLVIDYFWHIADGPRWQTHYPRFDAAAIDETLAALALPDERSGPAPTRPTHIYDAAAFLEIDSLRKAATSLWAEPYDPTREVYERQPLVFSRLRFESGPEGLELFGVLTPEGEAFLTLGDGGTIVERAGPMQGYRQPFAFDPGPRDPGYVFRGSPLERGWFDGPRSIGVLISTIASVSPEAVRGTIDKFKLQLPVGPLPGELESIAGLERVRGEISERGAELHVVRKPDYVEAVLRTDPSQRAE